MKLSYIYNGTPKLKVGECLLVYDDGTKEKLNKEQTRLFLSRKSRHEVENL